MNDSPSRSDGLSPWWRHGAILVMIGGFAILSYMTVQTYRNAPPIPLRVVDGAGNTVMTGEEIERGQEVFFKTEIWHVLGHPTPVMPQRSAHLQLGHLRCAVNAGD